jgi:hypothetical protein
VPRLAKVIISQFIKGLIELWVERKPEQERSTFSRWLWSKRPGTRTPWDFRDEDRDGYDDRFEPQKDDNYYR